MFSLFGKYILLLKDVFTKPTKKNLFVRQVSDEIYNLCINSVVIVVIISFFVGAAVTIQISFNVDSAFMPLYSIGFATRKSLILEFAPTIMSLILAGKIGSQIASQLGSMRISEQIDAIEVMGINPANYLILPKIIATLIFNPILIMLSIVVSLIGGWTIGVSVGGMSTYEYMYGLQFAPNNYDLVYALIKTFVFAFLMSTISSFYGYYAQGGSLEVGKASTKAVVNSSIAIILSNLLLTQLLMS